MIRTMKNRKWLFLTMGFILLAGMVEAVTASCDVARVCELVAEEKKKIEEANRSVDANKTQNSSDPDVAQITSDSNDSSQPVETDKEKLFEAARDEILNECGYEMDESENECRIEKVIRLCWEEKEKQLKKCRE